MKKTIFYLLSLMIPILLCWFSSTLLGGILNPGTLFALIFTVILIASISAPSTLRISFRIWIFAGCLILIGLFLPASFYTRIFPLGDAEPFSTTIALTQLLIISAAFPAAALLINSVLVNYYAKLGENKAVIAQHWKVFILSLFLIAKAIHNFYWFLIWDSTTDPLGMIWLPLPVFAVLLSSFAIFFTQSGKPKTIGFLNLLLIPVLIAVFIFFPEG